MLHGERQYYSKHLILGALMNKAARQVANVFSGWVIILTNSHVKQLAKCSLKLTTNRAARQVANVFSG